MLYDLGKEINQFIRLRLTRHLCSQKYENQECYRYRPWSILNMSIYIIMEAFYYIHDKRQICAQKCLQIVKVPY